MQKQITAKPGSVTIWFSDVFEFAHLLACALWSHCVLSFAIFVWFFTLRCAIF